MIVGIQIIAVLFVLIMSYFTFINFKKKDFTVKESVAWWVIWGVFVIFFIKPNIATDIVVKQLGFTRTIDFLIVGGFFFLVGISFYIYSVLRGTQRKIESIVRKIALEKKEKQ